MRGSDGSILDDEVNARYTVRLAVWSLLAIHSDDRVQEH